MIYFNVFGFTHPFELSKLEFAIPQVRAEGNNTYIRRTITLIL